MKNEISNSTLSTNDIVLNVQESLLIEAITNCNLGTGTISEPIKVDSFTTIEGSRLPSYKQGESINFKLVFENDDFEPTLVCCSLKNVTKNTDFNSVLTKGLYDSVFECGTTASALEDGSLCVMPNGACSATLKVRNAAKREMKDFYFSYSVLFFFECW